MPQLDIADGESLYYEYAAPGAAGKTVVFVNALTGNAAMWKASIGPALRAAGYGTLVYNFRGQAESRTAPTTRPSAPRRSRAPARTAKASRPTSASAAPTPSAC